MDSPGLQTNFGGNVSLAPNRAYLPENEGEVLRILESHRGSRIRCIGRLHSWSKIVEAPEVLLDLRELKDVQPTEGGAPSVWVGAGCQIKRLLAELDRQKGWTLPSVGFIAEQAIAGAISTGTHGSGRHSLSHYVRAVRVARVDRQGRAFIEEIDTGRDLSAARCSLGCLGVIVSVKMACRPKYRIEEHFREYQDVERVVDKESDFPLQQFYMVPWRWTFIAQHRCESDQPSSRLLAVYQWYRFLVFDVAMHLIILFALRVVRAKSFVRWLFRWPIPMCVIPAWRVVGPSTAQLVMEHAMFRHVEIEIFVSARQLKKAIYYVRQFLTAAGTGSLPTDDTFRTQIETAGCLTDLEALAGSFVHHYPICVRRILPDDTMISMASPGAGDEPGDPWYSISLINYHALQQSQPFEKLAAVLAKSMASLFGARPHWGKLCPLSTAELRSLYPRIEEFSAIRRNADPDDLFQNDWTQELF